MWRNVHHPFNPDIGFPKFSGHGGDGILEDAVVHFKYHGDGERYLFPGFFFQPKEAFFLASKFVGGSAIVGRDSGFVRDASSVHEYLEEDPVDGFVLDGVGMDGLETTQGSLGFFPGKGVLFTKVPKAEKEVHQFFTLPFRKY